MIFGAGFTLYSAVQSAGMHLTKEMIMVTKKKMRYRMMNRQYTIVPYEYIKPIKNQSTQTYKSDFIDLINKPKFTTVIPDGYIRCPESQHVLVFHPFISWLKMILKVKTVNTPKSGGAGYEDIMNNLLDQAQEILTTNSKRYDGP